MARWSVRARNRWEHGGSMVGAWWLVVPLFTVPRPTMWHNPMYLYASIQWTGQGREMREFGGSMLVG